MIELKYNSLLYQCILYSIDSRIKEIDIEIVNANEKYSNELLKDTLELLDSKKFALQKVVQGFSFSYINMLSYQKIRINYQELELLVETLPYSDKMIETESSTYNLFKSFQKLLSKTIKEY